MLDGLWLRPRRLKGLKSVEASLPLRQQRLHLSLRRLRGAEKAGFIVAGEFFPFRHEGLVLPYPDKDLQVQAILP